MGAWAAVKYWLDLGILGSIRPPGLIFNSDSGLLFGDLHFRQLSLEPGEYPMLLASLGLIYAYHHSGLYQSFRNDSRFGDFWCVLKGMLFFMLSAWIFCSTSPDFWVPWQFATSWAALTMASVITIRFAERTILKTIRAKGYNQRYILIIGARRSGQELAKKTRKCRWMGFQIIGFVDDVEELQNTSIDGIPVLGTICELPNLLEKYRVDQVYCALPFREMDRILELADILTRTTVDFRIIPDLVSLTTLNASFFDIDGLPVLGVRESPLQGVGSLYKRLFDLVFATLALIAFSPLMLLIAIAIKFSSPGPVFYRQRRVGWDGKDFEILKFRSMCANAEEGKGAQWTTAGDARRTRFGAFLRRCSLDELPQFFNVLKGEMSVVGPRPERPEFIKEFSENIPNYMLRHKTRAGLTGWAQVNGWRGNTSIRKRVQYDLYYIEHWSLWFDLRIILDTIFRGLIHRNAY